MTLNNIHLIMPRKVRVRFAPSPTGPLHIGGVRTALYNYLFAKKYNGDFILRIEDTDSKRFVRGAEEYIVDALKWCGIEFNEGVSVGGKYKPYRQSERKEIYFKYAKQLIDSGLAYYAFDSSDSLDKMRKEYESNKLTFSYNYQVRDSLETSLYLSKDELQSRLQNSHNWVIRFKMPENEQVEMSDIIRGKIVVNTSTLDDKVLFKAEDGLPTYHLANIVDDYLMEISHVIRGEEWLPSLPLHVLLYRALGWENVIPEFAHLPLLLKPDGKGKLSKRDGDKLGFPVFPIKWIDPADGEISSGYKEFGFIPEAFVNFLAMLGWNPGTEQELFRLDELSNLFSLEKCSKSGAKFDFEKARWFNQQYLQKKSNSELAIAFNDILKEKGINRSLDFIEKIVAMVRERAVFINDLWDQSSYFFVAPEKYDEQAVRKFWKEETSEIVADCIKTIEATEPFISAIIEEKIKTYIEANRLGFGKVMNPLRLAVVGDSKGPHLFDIFEMIGKEETTKRLKRAFMKIKI
jgi:glutamyl-tRNA synthetase